MASKADQRDPAASANPSAAAFGRLLQGVLEFTAGSVMLCAAIAVMAERPHLHRLWEARRLPFGGLDTTLVLLYLGYAKLALWAIVILPAAALAAIGRPWTARLLWVLGCGMLAAASLGFTLLGARTGQRFDGNLADAAVPNALDALGGPMVVLRVGALLLLGGWAAAAVVAAVAAAGTRRTSPAAAGTLLGLTVAAGGVVWASGPAALVLAGRPLALFHPLPARGLSPPTPEVLAYDEAVASETASALARIAAALTPPDEPASVAVPTSGGWGITKPDVVLILLESFRRDALDPELMPRLFERTRGGLLARNHTSSGNASHLGVFGLLDARVPADYPELERGAPRPSTLVAWARAVGYDCVFRSSGHSVGFQGMEKLLQPPAFDFIREDIEGAAPGWQAGDVEVLHRVASALSEPRALRRPRLEVVFLMSLHYPYLPELTETVFDPEHPPRWAKKLPSENREAQLRYANAARSLDTSLENFLESVVPLGAVVAITGDHGESFGEDGLETHAGAASDAQLAVPFWICGPGVAAGKVDRPSSHVDVVATLADAVSGVVPSSGHGRSLLRPLPERRPVLVAAVSQRNALDFDNERERLLVMRPDLPGSALADLPVPGLRFVLRYRPPAERWQARTEARGWMNAAGYFFDDQPPPVPVDLLVDRIKRLAEDLCDESVPPSRGSTR